MQPNDGNVQIWPFEKLLVCILQDLHMILLEILLLAFPLQRSSGAFSVHGHTGGGVDPILSPDGAQHLNKVR